jgi:hypothetical protein
MLILLQQVTEGQLIKSAGKRKEKSVWRLGVRGTALWVYGAARVFRLFCFLGGCWDFHPQYVQKNLRAAIKFHIVCIRYDHWPRSTGAWGRTQA